MITRTLLIRFCSYICKQAVCIRTGRSLNHACRSTLKSGKQKTSLPSLRSSSMMCVLCDARVKTQTEEVPSFMQHFNSVDSYIKFKRGNVRGNSFFVLCSADCSRSGRCWSLYIYIRNPPHKILHTLILPLSAQTYKLGVTRTLKPQAESVPTKTKKEEHLISVDAPRGNSTGQLKNNPPRLRHGVCDRAPLTAALSAHLAHRISAHPSQHPVLGPELPFSLWGN